MSILEHHLDPTTANKARNLIPSRRNMTSENVSLVRSKRLLYVEYRKPPTLIQTSPKLSDLNLNANSEALTYNIFNLLKEMLSPSLCYWTLATNFSIFTHPLPHSMESKHPLFKIVRNTGLKLSQLKSVHVINFIAEHNYGQFYDLTLFFRGNFSLYCRREVLNLLLAAAV